MHQWGGGGGRVICKLRGGGQLVNTNSFKEAQDLGMHSKNKSSYSFQPEQNRTKIFQLESKVLQSTTKVLFCATIKLLPMHNWSNQFMGKSKLGLSW